MKTIKYNGEYKRLPDLEADVYVNLKGWDFVPKNEWKKTVRDVKKIEIEQTKEKENAKNTNKVKSRVQKRKTSRQ